MASIIDVRNAVKDMHGKYVDLEINKGRNKIVKLTAKIAEVYPSMFVIKPSTVVDLDRKTFSYNDVLCGDIKFI